VPVPGPIATPGPFRPSSLSRTFLTMLILVHLALHALYELTEILLARAGTICAGWLSEWSAGFAVWRRF
jgi:hypothetical protein